MSRAKVLQDFLKGSTEMLGRAETTKTQHRVVSFFHAAVILLDPSIQVGAAAVFHFGTKDIADRARIRIVAITGYLARNLRCNGHCATKEPLGCRHVARRTEHGVDEIAFTIDRTIQVRPFALIFKYVSSTYQRRPTFPLRLQRSCSASSGAKRSSPLPYRFAFADPGLRAGRVLQRCQSGRLVEVRMGVEEHFDVRDVEAEFGDAHHDRRRGPGVVAVD